MPKSHNFNHDHFLVHPGRPAKLKTRDPAYTEGIPDKAAARHHLVEDVAELAAAQNLLWASASRSVLIIFQAIDAAGKDSTIKHVMSGVNPQGCEVHSFKAPTPEEQSHPFLWRPARVLPARGRIAVFNRSYYEEVLVVRVHPEWLGKQWVPPELRRKNYSRLWPARFDEINEFEKSCTQNGMCIIKFFLHVSKDEQARRFLERLTDPRKLWKFSPDDFRERSFWDDYMSAYEDMLSATSTKHAPWYIIPADHKWFTRACVADIIAARIKSLDLKYPKPDKGTAEELQAIRKQLETEV